MMTARLIRLGACLIGVAAAWSTTGCSGGPDLKLVPVKGKATYRGGTAVSGGMLEFRPIGDATEGAALADIGPDGSFVARTTSRGKTKEGMTPGSYEVNYFQPMGEDQASDPFTLGEITITDAGFPDANPLKIELPAPPKKK